MFPVRTQKLFLLMNIFEFCLFMFANSFECKSCFEWIATLQKYSLLKSTYQLDRHIFFSLESWCFSVVKPYLKLVFYKKGGIIFSLFITNRLECLPIEL